MTRLDHMTLQHPWATALVTGASAGIGRDFARILGEAKVPTLIVARRAERLAELQAEFPSLSPLVADLATPDGVHAVAERACGVDLLVNNAGLGFAGGFDEVPASGHQNMIDVNISALVALTRAAIAPMKARNRGWILQVSSVASFFPGPDAATYSATKAFVTSLTEAVHEELRGTSVIMTALCPGLTRTEFHQVSGSTESVARIPELAWLPSLDVATAGLAAVAAGKVLAVPGPAYKGVALLSGVLPRGVVRRAVAAVARRR